MTHAFYEQTQRQPTFKKFWADNLEFSHMFVNKELVSHDVEVQEVVKLL